VRPTFYCESCAAPFWRRKNHKDARRFCSKRCAGTWHRARTAARVQAERTQREIDRALLQAARETARLLRRCPCGASLDRRSAGGRFCRACVAARLRASNIRQQKAARDYGPLHCCPNCGRQFQGYEGAVFCSSLCSKRLHRKRYPTLAHIPLEERNHLAEMIALVRAARRKIGRDPNRADREIPRDPKPADVVDVSDSNESGYSGGP
jgi:endogenous inhibitor of DNA gyrase (YacG/DUF329 family)